MESINESFNQFLKCRNSDIVNHIAATNPEYKELSKQIIELQELQLIRDKPKETWLLVDKHRSFLA